MRTIVVLLCFLFCSLTQAEDSSKNEKKTPLSELKKIVVSGPYCGIYAFVAILDTFGMQPNRVC